MYPEDLGRQSAAKGRSVAAWEGDLRHEEAASRRGPVSQKRHRLVDEGLIAADIQKRLERLGYSVPAVAHSGEEALRFARTGPFDLVLMDVRLKGEMDGIATAEKLKAEGEAPVVYITAHADQETIHRAKLTEPFGYVLKPIGDGDLRSAVEIALYKHEMERRVRTSEAWLSATLRSIGEGVIATDTSGEVVFMNSVAQQLTGWSGAEAHGYQLMEVLSLFEDAGGRPAKNPIYDLLAGETRTYVLISRKGAKTPVEIGCFENQSENDLLGAIVAVRDISARRDLESRLIQSQRMEAVANLAGGLAHDFNNQLTVILGYAEELAVRLPDGDRQEAVEIQHAASIASSLTNQLLKLSRRELVHLEVLNVQEIICEVQPMISHSLGKARTLATDLGLPVGFVRGDRNQFKQILLNLAFNARDAMPAGGELRISVAHTEIEAASTQARLYAPGPYVRLVVADSGEGMDAETLSHIFEPFFTTKKAGLGTGLGLSIVHSIVSQAGGYISASSEEGRGTVFEILLPSIGTFQGTGEGGATERPAADQIQTVLLVEDEDRIRHLMNTYLGREGYQLLEARNAEEAEALVTACGTPIDILITDVIMPGLTGPQLAERMIRARPGLKVLYVSGYRHNTLEEGGVQRQGLNVLSKPFTASELVRRVRILLSHDTPVEI